MALGQTKGQIKVLLLQSLADENVARAPFELGQAKGRGNAGHRRLCFIVLARSVEFEHGRQDKRRVPLKPQRQSVLEGAVAADVRVERFGKGTPVFVEFVIVASGVCALFPHEQMRDAGAVVLFPQMIGKGTLEGKLVLERKPFGGPLSAHIGNGAFEITSL